ncbi:MAG TPA: endospore germination permease [Bacillota bacterium]|nr:endospore germination permease [Bacillota bacterium]
MDKQKISTLQLGMLMFPTIMITAVLLVPAVTSEKAGRDMWLSLLWGSISGVIAVFIAWKLHQQFKEKTIIQYSTNIVGRIPGKIIGLIYLLFYLHINSLTIIQYSHFVVGYFLNETPIIVMITALVVVCAIAVRSGVEVMGRSSQFFSPLIFIFIIFLFLLLIPELEYKHILPIMEDGIKPSIQGAAVPFAWFSHFFAISFFLPHLSSKSKGLTSNLLTVLFVLLALMMTNLFALMLFGQSTSSYSYPVWSATRYISVGGFLEHIEALIMAVWVAGVFVKVTVLYYILVSGTAQWFEVKNYKPLVFPLGFTLIVASIMSFPTLEEMAAFIESVIPYYLPTIELALPFTLLVIAYIKTRFTRGKGVDSRANR